MGSYREVVTSSIGISSGTTIIGLPVLAIILNHRLGALVFVVWMGDIKENESTPS